MFQSEVHFLPGEKEDCYINPFLFTCRFNTMFIYLQQ